MSALTLQGVTKRYTPDAAPAVADLNLSIEPGEIVALLGSSGCGKTSTLRMIAGFEEVTGGTIRVGGREVQRLAPAARNVAMAFEGYSLYPPLTVRENIAFALKSSRLARDEVAARVLEVARLLEIEAVLDRYPGGLSGGQQQRASLARALIRDADLHLLDEPMGQLEPQLRALLRGRIKHFIKQRGLTAILVTHDQTEANALADRIAVMEGGVLQQFATPGELKDRPANLFTGTFVGEPPMNVLRAEVEVTGEDLRLYLAGGTLLDYVRADFHPDGWDVLIDRRRLALGVRPHAVHLGSEGAPGVVVANQWLGDQSHIAAEFAGITLVSVAHSRVALAPGATVGVRFSTRDLHFFDADTGAAIVHAGRAA